MGPLPTQRRAVDGRTVTVRPTVGAQEHRHWDRLVTLGSTWVALVGWQAAALKLTARDRWIGWTLEQQLQRLHLVAQNSRFVILPDYQVVPNLASRVLGLSLRRLSSDMQREHGFPILLAESFVDRALFAGTCYRAANWRSLGFPGGYARQPAAVPERHHHGQPREVLVYELEAHARAALCQPEEDPCWQGPARTAPPSAPLAGYRGVTAFAQFAALLDPAQRQAVAAWTWQQNGQVPPDAEDTGSQEAAGRAPGEDARPMAPT